MGNSFGTLFKITTYGESHGKSVGVIIDGCPAGLNITTEEIQFELDRRRPGQSKITTQRKEKDQVEIQSGIYEDTTLGTSIGLIVQNEDHRSSAYDEMKDLFRPSHADYTYEARYGLRDWRGGGRASNRETIGRVAAGAVAKKFLKEVAGIETLSWVEQIYDIESEVNSDTVTLDQIEANDVRCPDQQAAEKMVEAIHKARKNGDSIGGRIRFLVRNCPAGFGAPVFDKLTAEIAKGLMSIPATRSIDFGMGRESINLTGWEHNDPISSDAQKEVFTTTNKAGGIVGGISNGEHITGTLTFKPTATINREQDTITREGEKVKLKAKGRHDPCVLPRAVPNVESMLNLILADHLLRYSVASMDRIKKIF